MKEGTFFASESDISRKIGLPEDLNKLPISLSQAVESPNMMLTRFEK